MRRILPLPTLDRPPGLPAAIEGTFDLAGTAVPVLRLDRLFGLPLSAAHIYQHLILCRDESTPLCLLVDMVSHILPTPKTRIAALADGETLNGCVSGRFQHGQAIVHMLDGARLLDQRERRMLADFQAARQRRYDSLETNQA